MNTKFFWGGAAISIVVVSWFLYRRLAPRSWREWTRAGLLQAFVIAFYADMYGFPITIYVLTRLFKLDVAGNLWDGNLWVYLTGVPAVMLVSMIAGYTLAFSGIALIVAGWREVHRAWRAGRLATTGPYRLIRHPQYAGLFVALFGESVVHWPTVFSLAAFPVIVLAYALLARREEGQMLREFSAEYRQYQRRVPMLVPGQGSWRALFDAGRLDDGVRRQ